MKRRKRKSSFNTTH